MIESIRKIVVLLVLMELILQLQISKKYEPFIKLTTRIMILCSISSLLFRWVGVLDGSIFETIDLSDISVNANPLYEVEEETAQLYIDEITPITIPTITIEKIE